MQRAPKPKVSELSASKIRRLESRMKFTINRLSELLLRVPIQPHDPNWSAKFTRNLKYLSTWKTCDRFTAKWSCRAVMKTVTFKKADIPRLLINNRVILTDLQIDLTWVFTHIEGFSRKILELKKKISLSASVSQPNGSARLWCGPSLSRQTIDTFQKFPRATAWS